MKFLVDAQLPKRLSYLLTRMGHDSIHASKLPEKNLTLDEAITEFADNQERVVISKDFDFVDLFLVYGRPNRLLFISTGNIGNTKLRALLERHIEQIEKAFAEHTFIELNESELKIHR